MKKMNQTETSPTWGDHLRCISLDFAEEFDEIRETRRNYRYSRNSTSRTIWRLSFRLPVFETFCSVVIFGKLVCTCNALSWCRFLLLKPGCGHTEVYLNGHIVWTYQSAAVQRWFKARLVQTMWLYGWCPFARGQLLIVTSSRASQ